MIIEKTATIYECCKGHYHRFRSEAELCDYEATYLEQCKVAINIRDISKLRVLLHNKPKDINIDELLTLSIRNNDMSAVRGVCESGHVKDLSEGLLQCVMNNNPGLVRILLNFGADPNKGSPSPLDMSIMEGKNGLVEMMKRSVKK